MKSLKDTQTAKNLAASFAGESQARNRYTFYASIARKEGYNQIAKVFSETADNERAHAKVFYDLLIAGLGHAEITVDAEYPIGLGSTLENLQYAAAGEREEWDNAYPKFAAIAKDEGFPEVEFAFRHIIEVEKLHEKHYLSLYEDLKNETLYKHDDATSWRCLNCGYIHTGTTSPTVCPACKHPQGYFEVSANPRFI